LMSSSINTLTTRFAANIQQFEAELRRLQRINSAAAANVAAAHARAARQSNAAWANSGLGRAIENSMGNIGPMLARYAGLIGSIFAGREALQATEAWTRFTNSLRVAGVEAMAMDGVQQRLYDSAVRNGIALEPLGQLYGRLAQSQRTLGATQGQLLQFTEGVTAALRIQGADAGTASGALLQLSQMLSAGTVRAEEFNSVTEGALPIHQAAARGIERFGGSVARMRAEVLQGKVSSVEYFEAFLRGSRSLEEQAAKAPLTVAQSFTNLRTALVRYIGETDQAYGVSERITQGLQWLAENIDTVKTSLLIVGGVYAATFVPALGAAGAALAVNTVSLVQNTVASVANRIALIQRTASLYGVSTASAAAALATRGLSAALAFFGGPVGLAIIGITAAIGYLGYSAASAALEAEALSRRIGEMTREREEAEAVARTARAETDNLSAAERQALVQTASLTGQVGLLATAYGRLAAEAKRARLEMIQTRIHEARDAERQAATAYSTRRDSMLESTQRQTRPFVERGMGLNLPGDPTAMRNTAIAANRTPEAGQLRTARRNREYYESLYGTESRRDMRTFVPTPERPAASGGARPRRGGGGGNNIAQSSQDAIRQAEQAYHQALHASATTAVQRNAMALEAIEEERVASRQAVERRVRENEITAAAGETALAWIDRTAEIKTATENLRRAEEVESESFETRRLRSDLDSERLRLESDELDDLAGHARTLVQKHEYEREALRRRQAADDLQFDLQQEQLVAERRRLGWTEELITSLREAAQANRTRQRSNEGQALSRQQDSERPRSFRDQLIDGANGFGDLNTQLATIAKGGIADITKGLTDAIMGAKSLKEAFTDMAKSIISQLIEMAIKFAIFEAIGMALGVPGLGKAAIGMGQVRVGGHASGTDFSLGGLRMVGEKGPELVGMPRGGQVVPNNLLRNIATPRATRNDGGNVNIFTTVNANDAVLTSTVKGWILEANRGAVQVSERVVNKGLQRRQQNALIRR
jgi:tape measure domain-containing protein